MKERLLHSVATLWQDRNKQMKSLLPQYKDEYVWKFQANAYKNGPFRVIEKWPGTIKEEQDGTENTVSIN